MTIYVTAIDNMLLAHAWVEATRLYGAMRDDIWYEKYHAIYEQMFDGSYDESLGNKIARLSRNEIQQKQDFVLVDFSDERLLAARGRLEDFSETKPNEAYAEEWRMAEENRDLDQLDSD